MTTIRELLKSKSPNVWSVSPEATVYEALELMSEKGIGAVAVVEGDALVGIFSERDYARNVVLKGRSSRKTRIRDLMSTQVLYLRPDQTVDDCMAIMTEKHVRHLPVLEEGKLVGLVTIGDVVKQIISAQDYLIGQLENYIKG